MISLFPLFLLTLHFSCENQSRPIARNQHPDFSFVAEQTGYAETLAEGRIVSQFGIRLRIIPKHNAASPFYFWTCDWWNYGFLDTDLLDANKYVKRNNTCDYNFEVPAYIDSINESLEITTLITREGSIEDMYEPHIRFGYHIFTTKEVSFRKKLFPDSLTAHKVDSIMSRPDHIVWSNILVLQKLESPPFDRTDRVRLGHVDIKPHGQSIDPTGHSLHHL